MLVYSNGAANATTVHSGGAMYVSSGGSATSTTVHSGGEINGFVVQQENYYSSGIHVSNAYVSGSTNLYSGLTATSTTVHSGGSMSVSSGGSARNTTVASGGRMELWGGQANATTVSSGGWMSVIVGASAMNIKINAGGRLTVDDGSVSETTIASGGVFNGIKLLSDNYYASGIQLSGGLVDQAAYLYDDQLATGLEIKSGGNLIVDGGKVSAAALGSGGIITLYGTADAVTITFGGLMTVSAGCVAENTLLDSGGLMTVSSGGTASILFNPWMGNVNSMTGASVTYLERDMNVYYGGSSAGLLGRGDTLSNVNVTSGLSAVVYSGGTLNGASLGIWGEMHVFGGGRVTGELNVEQGAVVSAYRGSVIDFDLSDRSSDSGALINDLTVWQRARNSLREASR